jgi:ferric-dicitrate binding protein FerR (iron transport regulator)
MLDSTVGLVAILVGVFCVFAGWHWKLMHRSWQDYRTTRATARNATPALRAARSRHTWKAFGFALAALIILFLLAKGG